LKPANILVVERDGELVPTLIDFGVARVLEPAGGPRGGAALDLPPDGPCAEGTPVVTVDGALVGTPAYMAPELWQLDPVGPGADQYALALVVFEALAGRRAFSSDSLRRMAALHHLAPLPRIGLDSHPAVDVVLARGAAKQAEDRYPDVVAFAAALRAAAAR